MTGKENETNQENNEQLDTTTEVAPVTVENLIETWNNKYTDNENILTLKDLQELVEQETHTPEQYLMLQTLFSLLHDVQHYQAGLAVLTDTAKALLVRNNKLSLKGVRSPKRKEELKNILKTSITGLKFLALDITTHKVDTTILLDELSSGEVSPNDFAEGLLLLETTSREKETLEKVMAEMDELDRLEDEAAGKE